MGRIIVPVEVSNFSDRNRRIEFNALVDTGAGPLILPLSWKDKLGDLEEIRTARVELADQSETQAGIYGPVRIQMQGFDPIYDEVMFLDMKPRENAYEALLGYIVLEKSQAAIDMTTHKLVHVKSVDAKNCYWV